MSDKQIIAKLTRTSSTDKQTLGILEVFVDSELAFSCKTLELPWKDNKSKVSCIPIGRYDVKYHNSPKFKMVLPWLQDTAPRAYILIHAGNYVSQIEGCILVGKTHADINGDGLIDVTESKVTLNALLKVLDGKPFVIEIINKD